MSILIAYQQVVLQAINSCSSQLSMSSVNVCDGITVLLEYRISFASNVYVIVDCFTIDYTYD